MGKFHKRIEAPAVLFIVLFILLALASPGPGTETRTAYTQDGIHYISKERVDENIRYEYAKAGDYREVQVPLNTIVVGASTVSQNTSMPQEKETARKENSPSTSNETASAPASENRYPYASRFIGLLIIGGLVLFVASVFSGRDRQ